MEIILFILVLGLSGITTYSLYQTSKLKKELEVFSKDYKNIKRAYENMTTSVGRMVKYVYSTRKQYEKLTEGNKDIDENSEQIKEHLQIIDARLTTHENILKTKSSSNVGRQY